MLGAHFDSWHASTGATDNAAGSAAMIEAMRILKPSGVKLRRTVRIGLWTGEEQGLIGSRLRRRALRGAAPARAADAPPDAARTRARGRKVRSSSSRNTRSSPGYFNIDNGTGAIRGVYLQGNDAVGADLPRMDGAVPEPRHDDLTIRNTGGTDHQSFDAVGLPGFQFIQDELEYRHDDAPHEPGQLRAAAGRGHAEERDDRGVVRLPRREPRREAAAQAAAGHGRGTRRAGNW